VRDMLRSYNGNDYHYGGDTERRTFTHGLTGEIATRPVATRRSAWDQEGADAEDESSESIWDADREDCKAGGELDPDIESEPPGSEIPVGTPEDTEARFNHRAQGSGENEWYTPERYITAAREVMGSIDLDPATATLANETIGADAIFTKEDDGLSREWSGNVWLNPPYAQPWIADFMQKLVDEVQAGSATQAIALTHNYTDTKWFQGAAAAAQAICFTRGRIGFLSPSGEKAAATQGQAFFYFGPHHQTFVRVFSQFGLVLRPNA
jgi:phage N-6-adenine-methyltransferase